MSTRKNSFLVAILAGAIFSSIQVNGAPLADDPLRHGHALLIGNAHYKDRRWPPLEDVPL